MAPDRTLDPSTLGDHIDRLFRAAWAMSGSRTEAEDLVQETFARVLAKPRRVRNADDLGYLLQALRNTFISSRRAAARRLAPEPLADRAEPIDPRTASRPEQAVEAREVFAVIAGLQAKGDAVGPVAAVDVESSAVELRLNALAAASFRARGRGSNECCE